MDRAAIISSLFQLVPMWIGIGYAGALMTWIKTIPLSDGNADLQRALESRSLYPEEYATPAFPVDHNVAGIVASHSLIPDALFHAFSTFGVLMSPDLPLTRRQHEMITTTVSTTNRCFY